MPHTVKEDVKYYDGHKKQTDFLGNKTQQTDIVRGAESQSVQYYAKRETFHTYSMSPGGAFMDILYIGMLYIVNVQKVLS